MRAIAIRESPPVTKDLRFIFGLLPFENPFSYWPVSCTAGPASIPDWSDQLIVARPSLEQRLFRAVLPVLPGWNRMGFNHLLRSAR